MFLRASLPALFLSFASFCALAEPLAHLHQVREPAVEGVARDAMLTRALDSLIVRLSGKADAPQAPALAELRAAPEKIISQFGFEADGSALVVEFDPASSERALRQAGLALWGNNRPLILAWWLEEELGGSTLVGDGQSTAETLRRAAQHRGLPLRLPLADLNEQLAATSEALSSAEFDGLAEVSERYAADVLLAVVSAEQDGKWQAQWRIRFLDQTAQGKVSAADREQLADAVMLAVLQRLAEHFVAPPGAASDLEVWIEGANLARYADLERLLDALGARLVSVEGDRLVYAVKASPDQLRAQLGLLQLQEVDAPAPSAEQPAADGTTAPAQIPANRLWFRW
ncbi:DUF2066 domain-containing protein [Pseudomonas mangrovi]|uniref:DUF2066 domain-containing protein n=1 Tax=Pseudomonas mangrovi TaxID=2161748 RepID=A0A2T5P4T6_9PSED|nr:DUF2066 domain-containing protein [Pseudomonas mangrovi]PTU72748.1 DUF2066 domain-containing protein [Pseudomonas mangrovi]